MQIEVRITGPIDKDELPAVIMAIDAENVRRAAATPPLPALPKVTLAEQRASYAAIYTPRVLAAHLANMDAAVEASADTASFKALRKKWARATPAQQAAADAALDA